MRARRQRWPHRHALAAGLSDHHETGLSDPDLTDALFAIGGSVGLRAAVGRTRRPADRATQGANWGPGNTPGARKAGIRATGRRCRE